MILLNLILRMKSCFFDETSRKLAWEKILRLFLMREGKTDGIGQGDGLTKRVKLRKMGTYVRITAPGCERDEDGETKRRTQGGKNGVFLCAIPQRRMRRLRAL